MALVQDVMHSYSLPYTTRKTGSFRSRQNCRGEAKHAPRSSKVAFPGGGGAESRHTVLG